jgi:hypothetical protein
LCWHHCRIVTLRLLLPPLGHFMHQSIGNNLKTSKKWKLQGSWNGTIVLTNKKITKVVCFKCYNHKTMACNN